MSSKSTKKGNNQNNTKKPQQNEDDVITMPVIKNFSRFLSNVSAMTFKDSADPEVTKAFVKAINNHGR